MLIVVMLTPLPSLQRLPEKTGEKNTRTQTDSLGNRNSASTQNVSIGDENQVMNL